MHVAYGFKVVGCLIFPCTVTIKPCAVLPEDNIPDKALKGLAFDLFNPEGPGLFDIDAGNLLGGCTKNSRDQQKQH
jgi:hypothetical protein